MKDSLEYYFKQTDQLVKEIFFEKYCDIDWHCDGAMEKKIMQRECTDLQLDVRELIADRLKELDIDIEEWELDNEEEWYKKQLSDIKTDMLYERNNDL